MNDLLIKLTSGTKTDLGNSNDVITLVGNNPEQFDKLFDGLFSENELVLLRTADILNKITDEHPELIQRKKIDLLNGLDVFKSTEVRWHVSLLLYKSGLQGDEVALVLETLLKWLKEEDHKFVKVNCLQALANIAIENPELKYEVGLIINEEMEKGSASIKARGRKLLKMLA